MEAIASAGKTKPHKKHIFNVELHLASVGVARKVVDYRKSEKAYSQGDSATEVLYVQKGGIKLSVANVVGKETVRVVLGPHGLFCEGFLAGQHVPMATASAIAP